MNIHPLNQVDMYKVNHYRMYPENTVKIYSNMTPRKSRIPGIDYVVVFGIQYFIKEYLIKEWNTHFFKTSVRNMYKANLDQGFYTQEKYDKAMNGLKEMTIRPYKRMIDATCGPGTVEYDHIGQLWDLGYLPLHIKCLQEGTRSPIGVPVMTITNTVDHAYWLVNYLETIISCSTWQAITSATIADSYHKLLSKYAIETTGDNSFVQWQGHDFSMRGMSSLETACLSGSAHLLSFTGTDTIPAISFLEKYYGANVENELVGASVPATEHSVMCMGSKDDEIGTFERLIDLYPKGILSIVSDTWDLWKVCTEYLPQLKEKILARDGKLVIRPDSGDPVDIICGYDENKLTTIGYDGVSLYKLSDVELVEDISGAMSPFYRTKNPAGTSPISVVERKGVIELLWDTFGGTINEQGYKVLDPHIGAIYGDSITLDRADQICKRLKDKGFASTNIILGIGSFTFQYNTRDSLGFAVKATYGEVMEEVGQTLDTLQPILMSTGREIFKDPITDDGTKKSKKGLLGVFKIDDNLPAEGSNLVCIDQLSKHQETQGLLTSTFLDGELVKEYTLADIRSKLKG